MILKRTLAFTALVVMSMLSSVANAQTDAFPQNEGGFEAGTTFAANGWTEVNANNNKWYVGTFTKFTGLRGAYIDRNNTAGTANGYVPNTNPYISLLQRLHYSSGGNKCYAYI